jgi:glutamine amidotransferase
LYHSHSIAALKEVAPPELRNSVTEYSDDARAVVSEPLTELPGPWKKIPESTFLTVERGEVHYEQFRPEMP